MLLNTSKYNQFQFVCLKNTLATICYSSTQKHSPPNPPSQIVHPSTVCGHNTICCYRQWTVKFVAGVFFPCIHIHLPLYKP